MTYNQFANEVRCSVVNAPFVVSVAIGLLKPFTDKFIEPFDVDHFIGRRPGTTRTVSYTHLTLPTTPYV